MKTSSRTKAKTRHLPNRYNRWKWMAGATASLTVGSAANAAVLSLNGNYVNNGGVSLTADLTAGPNPLIAFAMFRELIAAGNGFSYDLRSAYLRFGGGAKANAFSYTINHPHYLPRVAAADVGGVQLLGSGFYAAYASGTIPVSFSLVSVNSGALTNGFLSVTASADIGRAPLDRVRVELGDLTYDVVAVPEPATAVVGLALLALAGGVRTRRQRLRTTA